LKVDVEGHELPVFMGAEKMLSEQKISVIQFEYGGCNLDSRVFLSDIWGFLESYGYGIAKIHPNGLHHYDGYEQRLEAFKYSNWVALNGKT
jgi:hypothetical protein